MVPIWQAHHYVLPDMGYDEIMYLLCQKPQLFV